MANIITLNKDKNKIKNAKVKKPRAEKKKIDWAKVRASVRYGCKAVVFRVLEAIVLLFVVSTICLLIGSSAIPLLAYDMSEGFGLTQSTNIYIAIASWILPMLFYTLLIAAATFCVLKHFIRWNHAKFTALIDKPKHTDNKTIKENDT